MIDCIWEPGEGSDKLCTVCKRPRGTPEPDAHRNCGSRPVRLPVEIDGPGNDIEDIFKSLNAPPSESCECERHRREMNRWGVAGCRTHRETIVAWMRKAYEETPWWDRQAMKVMAIRTGLYKEISWTDPIPSIVDLAINRFEQRQNNSSTQIGSTNGQ